MDGEQIFSSLCTLISAPVSSFLQLLMQGFLNLHLKGNVNDNGCLCLFPNCSDYISASDLSFMLLKFWSLPHRFWFCSASSFFFIVSISSVYSSLLCMVQRVKQSPGNGNVCIFCVQNVLKQLQISHLGNNHQLCFHWHKNREFYFIFIYFFVCFCSSMRLCFGCIKISVFRKTTMDFFFLITSRDQELDVTAGRKQSE